MFEIDLTIIVLSMVIQNDGKIIVGGGFWTYSWATAYRIARINTDWSKDNNFSTIIWSDVSHSVSSLAIQSDGKIIVWWFFWNWNIRRLNKSGIIDTTFNVSNWFNQAVNSIIDDEEGRIIVWWLFTSFNDNNILYLSRLWEHSQNKIFRYIVQSWDISYDLDYLNSNSLILDGWTIKNKNNIDANLILTNPWNLWSLWYNKDIIIWQDNITAPIVSTWYIYSWTTWNNWATWYYKWTVDIRADIIDNIWISGDTCEYSIDWTNRSWANYSWTSTNWYCYKIGIVWWSDLNINFRVKDTSNNLWTWTAKLYVYDDIAPIITQITTREWSRLTNPTTWDQNLLLSSVDTGAWIENTWYCIWESMLLTCSPNITWTNVLFTCNTWELCQNKVLYYSKDLLWNIEDTKQSWILTIDKQGPQNIWFDINNWASIVTWTNINLTNITGYDLRWLFYPNTTQIAYGTSSNVNNRTWLSSTKSFMLPNIDWEYTIYMRFRDWGWNISMTSWAIILDANSPVITINNPNVNPAQIKTISASTNEWTLTMTTWSTNTTCDASRNFITYESITFTGESDNGKYVCYRVIDSWWNTTYNLSNAIAGIDRTKPTMSVIPPSTIVWETGVLISVNTNENSECRYLPSALLDFDNMVLLEWTWLSHSWNHIGSEWINTLYFRCKDVAWNISTWTLYEFTVNLWAPVIQFVIWTTPNNPTNNSGVNIYLTWTNITKYKYEIVTWSSCNGVVYDWAEINITNPITQWPSISDERYSYCAIWYKTWLNQWQAEWTRYDFVYDNTPPVITINDWVNTNWNTWDNINLSVNYNLAGISETKYVWSTWLVCDWLNYSSWIIHLE